MTAHPLLQRETLVVAQKAKLFELRNEFALLDEAGQRIGSVQQVRQSVLAKVLRIASDLDVALPVTLEVRDAAGAPVLVLHKPWFKWSCEMSRPDGTPLGSIRKEIRLGKARFAISGAAGEPLASVSAKSWRARDFTVRDTTDVEIARVAKQWRGVARELFTDADTYVVSINPMLGEPLRSLSIGSCLAIDTIMKQKDSQ